MSELVNQMSAALRARHYSRRTAQAYRLWVRRFIRFHGIQSVTRPTWPIPEINAYLTHLAVAEQVSASTQTQALSALLFLYRHVIGRARWGSLPVSSAHAHQGACLWSSRATR